jgi:hypothetical protein
MVNRAKKYFSFFGMMAATIDVQIQASRSSIRQLKRIVPMIEQYAHVVVLKPVQIKNKIK